MVDIALTNGVVKAQKSNRNLNLDLLRGFFHVEMFIAHLSIYLGSNALYSISHKLNYFVSAAEGFVFLSGYVLGTVYYKKIQTTQVKEIFIKLWKRAGMLYIIGAFLTTFFAVWAMYIGAYSSEVGLKRFEMLFNVVKDALRYKYFYGFGDIIAMYAPYVFIAPIALLLFKKRLAWLVLIISFVLWSFSSMDSICRSYCLGNNSLWAWQILFIVGLFVGSYKDKFKDIYKTITKSKLINIILFFLYGLSMYVAYILRSTGDYDFLFSKNILGLGRLFLFVFWIIYSYQIVEILNKFLSKYLGWILLTFGQNSLVTFVIHAIIVFSIQGLKKRVDYTGTTLIILAMIPILWSLVWLVIKTSKSGKSWVTSIDTVRNILLSKLSRNLVDVTV